MSIESGNSDVTPHRSDFFTNSDGNVKWSMCICGSTKLGDTNLFLRSITTVFGPLV